MSVHNAIADAVVAVLNGHSFSLAFTATRQYLAELALAEMSDTLHVTVVPGGIAREQSTRAKRQGDYDAQIGVRKRPPSLPTAAGAIDNALLDPLSNLVEEIDDHLEDLGRLTGYTAAVWLKSELSLPFSPEHLDKLHQFTSILTVTYRVWR